MDVDLLISGAGPAGLSLARALSGAGLRITLVEPQARAALEDPPFDGREIALTQHSVQLMRQLGMWERLDPADCSPLRDAQVLDGPSPFAMVIGHSLSAHSELGWLVSNHLIRRVAWQSLQAAQAAQGDITVLDGDSVVGVRSTEDAAEATLASGRRLTARLLVAADSRFSLTRRAMGIPADLHDFGRSMLVCVMTHDTPHAHTAWEWFGHGQTLALLPMNPDPATGAHRSSVVLTLPSHQIEPLLGLSPERFAPEIAARFEHRLGPMRLVSTRHAYPLVAVYPRRLTARRFACVGDAAVGMHPVTAHGFNFGLLGIDSLANRVRALQAAGRDIADPLELRAWERGHQRATRPLYLATQFITRLYTDDSPPARLLRGAALRLGERFTPFKRAIAASLTGAH